jgi:hypothetical protein
MLWNRVKVRTNSPSCSVPKISFRNPKVSEPSPETAVKVIGVRFYRCGNGVAGISSEQPTLKQETLSPLLVDTETETSPIKPGE